MDEKKTRGIGVEVKTGLNHSYFFRLESHQTIKDLRRQLESLPGVQADQQLQEITMAGRAVAGDVKLDDLPKDPPIDVITVHMLHNESSAAEIVTPESTARRCALM